ncbi:MAG: hypothetical protein II107_10880 [Prevotella sp.]|nr:hypothetical protein [Prevotella sp.]
MKKKALICLLGSAIVGAIAYYCYTMNKVSDIDDDTLEPDDEDLEDEDIFDDDIDTEFDEPIEPESEKVVQFNDVEQDDIFRQNNPIAVDEDEGDEATHGSKFHREPGGTGECTTPGHSFKNIKLPGHMGFKRVTVQNLKIVKVDPELKVIMVRGAVPGNKDCTLIVKSAVKK